MKTRNYPSVRETIESQARLILVTVCLLFLLHAVWDCVSYKKEQEKIDLILSYVKSSIHPD